MNKEDKLWTFFNGLVSSVLIINFMFFILGFAKDVIFIKILFWVNLILFIGLFVSLGENQR